MDVQFIVEWFNSWPTDARVLQWVAPRIVILGSIVYIAKIIAKLTPWTWDNVIVAAVDSVFGRFTKGKDKEKKPEPVDYKEIN